MTYHINSIRHSFTTIQFSQRNRFELLMLFIASTIYFIYILSLLICTATSANENVVHSHSVLLNIDYNTVNRQKRTSRNKHFNFSIINQNEINSKKRFTKKFKNQNVSRVSKESNIINRQNGCGNKGKFNFLFMQIC